jgi:hypothetical protein
MKTCFLDRTPSASHAMRCFALAAAVLLTACGGGGGGGVPVVNASAEGFWQGRSSAGYDVSLAVLENGETWGFYTTGNLLAGALYGQTTTSGNSLNGAGSDFNIALRTVTSGTYAGSVSPRSSLSVTTSGGGAFTGTYSASYDQPASLATAAGVFSGFGLTGRTASQAINATLMVDGTITVPSTGGCGASGRATPRSTGKNIFDVSVIFTGATCALGNGATTTGIAYYDAPTRQLLVMAMNAAKSDGFIYIGRK